MKEQLKVACRSSYLEYVTSYDPRTRRTCPQKEAAYSRNVAALIKVLKAEGPKAMEEYYRWASSGEESASQALTALPREVDSTLRLRQA